MMAEAVGLSFAGGALAAFVFSSAKEKLQEAARSLTGKKEDHPTLQALRNVYSVSRISCIDTLQSSV